LPRKTDNCTPARHIVLEPYLSLSAHAGNLSAIFSDMARVRYF
jgi:hypothetical protein